MVMKFRSMFWAFMPPIISDMPDIPPIMPPAFPWVVMLP